MQGLRAEVKYKAGNKKRSEYRRKYADCQADGKALYGPRTELRQKQGRNKSCDIRVHNRPKSAVEPRVDGGRTAFTQTQFIAYALKYNDVCVNRHTDG